LARPKSISTGVWVEEEADEEDEEDKERQGKTRKDDLSVSSTVMLVCASA
jgi:hypothetical protein